MSVETDARIAALEEQVASNAADAARYRHVRAGHVYIETACEGEELYMAVGNNWGNYPRTNLNEFDAAIDADILQLESKGEQK